MHTAGGLGAEWSRLPRSSESEPVPRTARPPLSVWQSDSRKTEGNNGVLIAIVGGGLIMGLATHLRRVQRLLLLPITATLRNSLRTGQSRVLTISWKKPYALVPAVRMRIECQTGTAWVTVEGDLNDHVLVPEQVFCVMHGDRALIVGMPTCRVRLVVASHCNATSLVVPHRANDPAPDVATSAGARKIVSLLERTKLPYPEKRSTPV